LKRELARKEAEIKKLKNAGGDEKSDTPAPVSSMVMSTPGTAKRIPGTARFPISIGKPNGTTPRFGSTPRFGGGTPAMAAMTAAATTAETKSRGAVGSASGGSAFSLGNVSVSTGMKKNPDIQKASALVMMAAMGLPDESECFDTPAVNSSDVNAMYSNNRNTSNNSNINNNQESYLFANDGDDSFGGARELSFSEIKHETRQKATMSFDMLIGYDRKGGSIIASHGRRGSSVTGPTGPISGNVVASQRQQQKLRRIHLGYKHEPRSKTPNLGIFKSSKCSSSSHKPDRNRFNGAKHAWEGEKKGGQSATAASKLFNERFSDNDVSALGKEVYRGLGI
jgi:hypothetical protein